MGYAKTIVRCISTPGTSTFTCLRFGYACANPQHDESFISIVKLVRVLGARRAIISAQVIDCLKSVLTQQGTITRPERPQSSLHRANCDEQTVELAIFSFLLLQLLLFLNLCLTMAFKSTTGPMGLPQTPRVPRMEPADQRLQLLQHQLGQHIRLEQPAAV